MKIIKFIIFCIAFSLALPSCTAKDDDGKYTGVRANEEVVSSIRQDILDKENSLLANENDVFWTESGKLWHSDLDCSYLSNSKTILHGTVEEAKLEGKEKGCERCTSTSIDSIYEALENNEYKSGDVFFTKECKVWHTNINCSTILGAQKIYFADITTAKWLGKDSACDECNK